MTLLMRAQENLEKGIQQGKVEAEAALTRLMQKLLEENRYDDLRRIAMGGEYRDYLCKMYGF